LKPATQFLGLFLAKNFIMEIGRMNPRMPEEQIQAIAQSAIFVAGKMREIDIHCPMIPKILGAGGKRLIHQHRLKGV
jgi:hypothetical protein